MNKRGVLRLSVGKFLSHSTAKLRGEHLCVLDGLLYGKKTLKRGVYHLFLSKFFRLKVTKDFVENRSLF